MTAEATPPRFRGPVEDRDWPQRLPARVVDPGPPTRMHGYEYAQDLAQHHSYAELVLTALRGSAPSDEEGRLFEAVMAFLLPITMAEAPTHCATLVRRCGAPNTTALAAGAAALSSQARELVASKADLLAWLEGDRSTPLPATCQRSPSVLDELVSGFMARVGPTPLLPEAFVSLEPTADALLIVAAHACGLRRAAQLEALLVCARLPAVAAEVDAQRPGELQDYPIDTPHYEYVPPARWDNARADSHEPESQP